MRSWKRDEADSTGGWSANYKHEDIDGGAGATHSPPKEELWMVLQKRHTYAPRSVPTLYLGVSGWTTAATEARQMSRTEAERICRETTLSTSRKGEVWLAISDGQTVYPVN